MWSVGDGYGFAIDVESLGISACKLLKLHGSTNWRGELFGGAMGFGQTNLRDLSIGQRPIIDKQEFGYLGYPDGRDPQCHRPTGAWIDALIMPGARKRFYKATTFGREWESFWDSLWIQAEEALRASDEVHIIGYSAPEFDTRARDLLAAVARTGARVYVCCHRDTEKVLATLHELGIAHAQPAAGTTFEEWLARQRGE